MRIETTESSIKLIDYRKDEGLWAVRWDFKPKMDESGNPTGLNWYEEDVFNYPPTIEDIQRVITEWFNKQTDAVVEHGFVWKGIRVLLNNENKFNYKAIRDEARDREADIKQWDKEHPELAGMDMNGYEPTGRPKSLLPVTLKLGESNVPENFYTFNTLNELKDFFSAGVEHLQGAYGLGWYKIATFDWSPYVQALQEL